MHLQVKTLKLKTALAADATVVEISISTSNKKIRFKLKGMVQKIYNVQVDDVLFFVSYT